MRSRPHRSLSALTAKILKYSNITLASGSPRRRELLSTLVKDFSVVPTDGEEIKYHIRPSYLVVKNAVNKALNARGNGRTVIAADTVVFMNGRYFLKPKDKKDAFDILKALSGKTHYVYTGVVIMTDDEVTKFYVKSAVTLKTLTEKQIDDYIATGSPMDKAGAYGIQDNAVVENYRGSYSNIMGLPLEELSSVINS